MVKWKLTRGWIGNNFSRIDARVQEQAFSEVQRLRVVEKIREAHRDSGYDWIECWHFWSFGREVRMHLHSSCPLVPHPDYPHMPLSYAEEEKVPQ